MQFAPTIYPRLMNWANSIRPYNMSTFNGLGECNSPLRLHLNIILLFICFSLIFKMPKSFFHKLPHLNIAIAVEFEDINATCQCADVKFGLSLLQWLLL